MTWIKLNRYVRLLGFALSAAAIILGTASMWIALDQNDYTKGIFWMLFVVFVLRAGASEDGTP